MQRRTPQKVGEFSSDDKAVSLAYGLLRQWKRVHPRKRLVVVFDIDATLLTESRDETKFFKLRKIVWLLRKVKELGGEVHLVTARNDDPSTKRWTEAQLSLIGLVKGKDYDSLSCVPSEMRERMSDVSIVKARLREKAAGRGGVVALTVGDQWTDLMQVKDDDEIESLDKEYGASFTIMRLNDGVSIWGLKLPYL